MNNGCPEYSVRIEISTTKCMTGQEYQAYRADQQAANDADMPYVLGGLGLLIGAYVIGMILLLRWIGK